MVVFLMNRPRIKTKMLNSDNILGVELNLKQRKAQLEMKNIRWSEKQFFLYEVYQH